MVGQTSEDRIANSCHTATTVRLYGFIFLSYPVSCLVMVDGGSIIENATACLQTAMASLPTTVNEIVQCIELL